MSEHELAAIAVKIADLLKNSPHLCLHATEWGKVGQTQDMLVQSQGQICVKVDVLTEAVYKMRGERNVIIAVIGASGVILGSAIPFLFPLAWKVISKVI